MKPADEVPPLEALEEEQPAADESVDRMRSLLLRRWVGRLLQRVEFEPSSATPAFFFDEDETWCLDNHWSNRWTVGGLQQWHGVEDCQTMVPCVVSGAALDLPDGNNKAEPAKAQLVLLLTSASNVVRAIRIYSVSSTTPAVEYPVERVVRVTEGVLAPWPEVQDDGSQ